MFHLQKATQVTSAESDQKGGDDTLLGLAEHYRYPPRPAEGGPDRGWF